MITIENIGLFDETKGFFEQEDEAVRSWLQEIVNTFNDFTAIERDKHNRPIRWHYQGAGVEISSLRTYRTNDENYFLDNQTFKITQYGNI